MSEVGVCALAVGGIGLGVECPDETLLAALRARYARFANAGASSFRVQIEVGPASAQRRTLAPRSEHRMGGVRFVDDGFEAEIEPQGGLARARIASSDPLGDVDYLLRCVVALVALDGGGLVLHAAGVVRGGAAHVFFGPSGCGKSTVARLSAGHVILSDDLVLLQPIADGWVAHATPFCNPPQRHADGTAHGSLAGLYRLEHAPVTSVTPLDAARAVAELVGSAPVANGDPSRAGALLRRCRELAECTPVALLSFSPDPAFWDIILANPS